MWLKNSISLLTILEMFRKARKGTLFFYFSFWTRPVKPPTTATRLRRVVCPSATTSTSSSVVTPKKFDDESSTNIFPHPWLTCSIEIYLSLDSYKHAILAFRANMLVRLRIRCLVTQLKALGKRSQPSPSLPGGTNTDCRMRFSGIPKLVLDRYPTTDVLLQ